MISTAFGSASYPSALFLNHMWFCYHIVVFSSDLWKCIFAAVVSSFFMRKSARNLYESKFETSSEVCWSCFYYNLIRSNCLTSKLNWFNLTGGKNTQTFPFKRRSMANTSELLFNLLYRRISFSSVHALFIGCVEEALVTNKKEKDLSFVNGWCCIVRQLHKCDRIWCCYCDGNWSRWCVLQLPLWGTRQTGDSALTLNLFFFCVM